VSIRIRCITGVTIQRRIFLQIARKEEPTSGLEPLTCSLGVIHQTLQEVARACKPRKSRGFLYSLDCSLLRGILARWMKGAHVH
jgi:hypothetical protein